MAVRDCCGHGAGSYCVLVASEASLRTEAQLRSEYRCGASRCGAARNAACQRRPVRSASNLRSRERCTRSVVSGHKRELRARTRCALSEIDGIAGPDSFRTRGERPRHVVDDRRTPRLTGDRQQPARMARRCRFGLVSALGVPTTGWMRYGRRRAAPAAYRSRQHGRLVACHRTYGGTRFGPTGIAWCRAGEVLRFAQWRAILYVARAVATRWYCTCLSCVCASSPIGTGSGYLVRWASGDCRPGSDYAITACSVDLHAWTCRLHGQHACRLPRSA